jgi:excisionase family DNA binding protein
VAELLPDRADDPWLGARAAAAYLRLSYSTLKERAARGELPAYQDVPGGSLYFKRSELDEHRRSGSRK